MTVNPDAPLLTVLDGNQRRCVGHLLSRGRDGWEAYDASEHSLGCFSDTDAAARAVWRAAHKQLPKQEEKPR